jgi:hypothetical protein
VGIVASMRCEQTLFSKVNDMAIIWKLTVVQAKSSFFPKICPGHK